MTTGTTGADWAEQAAAGGLPPLRLDLDGRHRVVVLAAHPDDEVLAAGGLMRRVAGAGAHLTVVWATDGEAAVPHARADDKTALGRLRRDEAAAGLRSLGVHPVRTVTLSLPDGRLAGSPRELVELLQPLVADADLVLSTWRHDGHPDHDALGRAAALAVPAERLLEYPVWAWHRGSPADACGRAQALLLDDDDVRAKEAAIAAHSSQVRATEGRPPVLAAKFLAHFSRRSEVFFGVG